MNSRRFTPPYWPPSLIPAHMCAAHLAPTLPAATALHRLYKAAQRPSPPQSSSGVAPGNSSFWSTTSCSSSSARPARAALILSARIALRIEDWTIERPRPHGGRPPALNYYFPFFQEQLHIYFIVNFLVFSRYCMCVFSVLHKEYVAFSMRYLFRYLSMYYLDAQ